MDSTYGLTLVCAGVLVVLCVTLGSRRAEVKDPFFADPPSRSRPVDSIFHGYDYDGRDYRAANVARSLTPIDSPVLLRDALAPAS